MRELKGHLTEEWIDAFLTGRLKEEERQEFLKHMGSCDYCSEQLLDRLEKELLEPPAYLREEIMERRRCADVQAAKAAHEWSRSMRLFLYSLKVGLAVAASLFILFFTSGIEASEVRIEQPATGRITEALDEKSDMVNGYLQELTRQLVPERIEGGKL